jgi:hypothetical protein
VSDDDYDFLVDQQAGECGICGHRPEGGRKLYIDHDHDTGVIRGLLCQRCNTGIGMLGDDLSMIERAARYLRGGLSG